MVWPADTSLYDWSPSDSNPLWDGQPIPIDDLDHVFDPLDSSYRTPAHNPVPPTLFPQQQYVPAPEQAQVVAWSSEEQATMDRYGSGMVGNVARAHHKAPYLQAHRGGHRR